MTTRSSTVLVASLTVSAFVSAAAHAECLQWDLSGRWNFTQSNGYTATFDFEQSGNTLRGAGHYAGNRGSVKGTVGQYGFDFTVDWRNGSVGYYESHIEDSGALTFRTTYDIAKSGPKVSWSPNGRKAKCLKTSTEALTDILRRKRNQQ